MIWDIFKNIQYGTYYKAIFVLFSALMIISLFIDVKAISNSTLFYASISSVIYSVIMWTLNDLARIWERKLNELGGQMNIDYIGNLKKIMVLHILGAIHWVSAILIILLVL